MPACARVQGCCRWWSSPLPCSAWPSPPLPGPCPPLHQPWWGNTSEIYSNRVRRRKISLPTSQLTPSPALSKYLSLSVWPPCILTRMKGTVEPSGASTTPATSQGESKAMRDILARPPLAQHCTAFYCLHSYGVYMQILGRSAFSQKLWFTNYLLGSFLNYINHDHLVSVDTILVKSSPSPRGLGLDSKQCVSYQHSDWEVLVIDNILCIILSQNKGSKMYR